MKGNRMLKKSLLLISILGITACSNETTPGSSAPTEDQAKQAIYERFKGPTGEEKMKEMLKNDLSVSGCKKEDNGYVCNMKNNKNGADVPLFFVFDKTTEKWKIQERDSYKN